MNKILIYIPMLIILSFFVLGDYYHINDSANLLDDVSEGKLEDVCKHINKETDINILILTLNNSVNVINNSDYQVVLVLNLNDLTIINNNVLTNEDIAFLNVMSQPLFNNGKYYEGYKVILNEIQIKLGSGGIGGTDKIFYYSKIWSLILYVVGTLIGLIFVFTIYTKFLLMNK